MRRSANNISLAIILLFSNLFSGLAQKESEIRKVTITAHDSVIKTSVLEKVFKGKIADSRTYYWYYAGKINHNQGGFSGKLIYGKYEVFDNQQRLLTLGNFINGLKEGTWIRWNSYGKIQQICSFKKGNLNGTLKTFTITGNLLKQLNYTNDFLDGKSRYYLKDTVIIKKYRMGKEVSPQDHRKLFSKAKIERHDNDSALINQDDVKKSPTHRRLFSGLRKQPAEKDDNSKTPQK